MLQYISITNSLPQVEVKLKSEDVRKKAFSEFFENEAELSGSEAGSEDEDDKDELLNRYEKELGDAVS